jgi:hypothetical protein
VLSHEAIIDAAWDDALKLLLLDRFPQLSEEELREAHGYAYGGAIIQDMGYYPFGSHQFSDLTHYFRSGDFIVNLIGEANSPNELAFALGSLAHYAADNIGHQAVNRSVPVLYPKLRARFGAVATYEDNPSDHLKTEFAFDVAEVAAQHYAPQAYHDFIGFHVSKELLERAFQQTYGIPLTDVSKALDLALGTYRWSVSTVIPEMTRVAWKAKQKEIQAAQPGRTRQDYVYVVSRASFEKEWGAQYQRPGLWARFLAFLLVHLPKIGPLRALAFHPATPETQKLFTGSFVQTLALYREKLKELRATGRIRLENTNFDTGGPEKVGAYRLADGAAEKLIEQLRKDGVAPEDELHQALRNFFGQDPLPASAAQ